MIIVWRNVANMGALLCVGNVRWHRVALVQCALTGWRGCLAIQL
ncbi:TPA: hypothetical protein ACJJYX_004368 [Enterobacter cloacae]